MLPCPHREAVLICTRNAVTAMSTELLLLDQAIFQDILWELQIWDQPFGRFIHPRQRSALTASTPATNSGKGEAIYATQLIIVFYLPLSHSSADRFKLWPFFEQWRSG